MSNCCKTCDRDALNDSFCDECYNIRCDLCGDPIGQCYDRFCNHCLKATSVKCQCGAVYTHDVFQSQCKTHRLLRCGSYNIMTRRCLDCDDLISAWVDQDGEAAPEAVYAKSDYFEKKYLRGKRND